jgi:uncharacterized protein (DUF2336 family)
MQPYAVESLLSGKDEHARSAIARRVGERLTLGELDEADRKAAEALAKALAADAVERVRAALSLSVRHAKYLPRPIALKIAHDVDSVACPFLETTEVFSEADWQQLVLTISHSALVAVARRASMPESLAVSLAELGDQQVAATLVANAAVPMTVRVCGTLIDRFQAVPAIMDGLAARPDLLAEVAVQLTTKVSAAVRAKLEQRYGLPDHTAAVVGEAEGGALLAIVRRTPPEEMPALALALRREGKLGDMLLLQAAGETLTTFVAAALAERAGVRLEQAEGVLLHAGARAVVELLRKAGIADTLHDAFWAALSRARSGNPGRWH